MASRFTDCYSEKQSGPIGGYWKYPLLSLKDALVPVLSKIDGLDRDIKEAYEYCHFPSEHGLTKDEAAAIFLYTLEAGEYSFYVALNRALRDEERKKITPWFSYLKLFDTALEKLPTVKGCIWRGVPRNVSQDYVMGDVKIWWSVNSCSSVIKVVEDFLNSNDDSTLFMIEAANGKDLTGYTNFPHEEEVLLKMGTKLRVKSNAMKHGKLHLIHLVEIGNNNQAEIPATTAAAASYVEPKPPTKTVLKSQEFAASSTCKELDCKGRLCAKCRKCHDWHFTGNQDQWNWVCNWKNWEYADWCRWYTDGTMLLTKRDGATCVSNIAYLGLLYHPGLYSDIDDSLYRDYGISRDNNNCFSYDRHLSSGGGYFYTPKGRYDYRNELRDKLGSSGRDGRGYVGCDHVCLCEKH
ncbi:unnamed protein product [Adineta steineri]|nr:unnamed protein product [Adineta steineri]